MSAPLDRMASVDEPSPYAPKWIGDAAAKRNTATDLESVEKDAGVRLDTSAAAADEGVMIERFRLPRSLEPTVLPDPFLASSSLAGVLRRLALAVAIAGAIAVIIVAQPWINGTPKLGEEVTAFLPRFVGLTSLSEKPANSLTPRLVAGQAAPRRAGESLPFGVSIRGSGEGASLVIRGLANGATLSPGRAAGESGWRLSSAEIESAMIRPPQGFVGAMDLSVELRLADDTLSDRRSLRFEWVAPVVAESDTKGFTIRPLDPDEIAALLKRGDELIASGDLGAARLVLRRAAEAGNARAALALAGTYDPIVLEKRAVHGFVPDIAMARSWYEKAKQFGSVDAPQRLEMLASRRE
jgi:hypothetical protein